MKKILFTSFVLFLTTVGLTQKKLRDKESKILYSYILDSLYKMGPDKYNNLPFTIKRETDSYDILNDNTFNLSLIHI